MTNKDSLLDRLAKALRAGVNEENDGWAVMCKVNKEMGFEKPDKLKWVLAAESLLTEYESFIQSQAKEKGEPKIGFFAMTEEGFKQPQPKDVHPDTQVKAEAVTGTNSTSIKDEVNNHKPEDVQQDTQVKPEEPATGGVKTAEEILNLCTVGTAEPIYHDENIIVAMEAYAAQFQSPQPSAVWVKASTPPKDGSWILAWVEMGIRILYFENGTFRWNDNGDEVRHFTVTHWTPLPQPPTSI
jgi:hypothetical protein